MCVSAVWYVLFGPHCLFPYGVTEIKKIEVIMFYHKYILCPKVCNVPATVNAFIFTHCFP
jgi:hypothetical protein